MTGHEAARRTFRICLADPDDCVRTGLEFFLGLQFPGSELTLFNDPDAAARSLLQDPPDLLITDLATPEGNRPEVLMEVLQTRQCKVPVILITAATPDRVGAFVAGAGSCKIVYLPNPFSADGLLTALNRC